MLNRRIDGHGQADDVDARPFPPGQARVAIGDEMTAARLGPLAGNHFRGPLTPNHDSVQRSDHASSKEGP